MWTGVKKSLSKLVVRKHEAKLNVHDGSGCSGMNFYGGIMCQMLFSCHGQGFRFLKSAKLD